ncbi:MAG: DUF1192 domain-containing protein [Thermaurantiacus sp.]
MDPDDLLPRAPGDPLRLLAGQDLDPLSVAELDARIAALEAEISRTRAKRDAAARFRTSADSLFGRRES